MDSDTRWKLRFINFEKSYLVYKRRLDAYMLNQNGEAEQMSLVQSFEMVQELSWKVLKDYLEEEGYRDISGSKHTFRQAFSSNLIDNTSDTDIWIKSIYIRNLSSHTYNDDSLKEALIFLSGDFEIILTKLYNKLKKEM